MTLRVSWQLDGGAAAVNEADRMDGQAYRMSLSVGTDEDFALPQRVADIERSLGLLRHGDLERPLFVSRDGAVRARLAVAEADGNGTRRQWTTPGSRFRGSEDTQDLGATHFRGAR